MKRPSRVTARTRSLWTVLIGFFSITGLRPTPSVKGESVDVVKVSAVAGGDATLPCDTFSKTKSDVLLLVVWYKNNAPLYSFDGRVPGPTAHWSDEVLQGRARWHSTNPSSLRIRNILPTDRATYHCRVDFKISPTKNHKVQLEVIELPEKPKIFDETDKELVGVAGPYVEDRTDLRLTCVVSGGKPMPRLRWWRNDKVISTLLPLNDDTLLSVLELKIPILTRDYYEAVYTCTADNTVLVPPARVNIQINMYLRPLFVEILPREQPLTVSQSAEIACRAVGARPPAAITWWLDDRQLMPTGAQKDTEDKNGTISYLQWTPTMADNHHRLTCRAAHIKLEDTTIETSIKLNLHYIPIVNLTLGPTLNPNDIEENDDVYFDCTVDSFPPAYKVVWEHEGQVMTHNQRAGIIAGSAHLALQSVKRHQAGKYRCTASNVEGDGTSDPIHLQVIYKPICKLKMKTVVGVALNEATKVLCEVDGFPTPKSFQWILNNSMGAVEIEANKFTQDEHGRSVLTYTATSERDYGSLTCKASNLAGQQVEGCYYTLLPAVRPDPLANCSSLNLTEDSAEIKCAAGYDGGLQTSYTVEVWELKKLIANVSTAAPSWLLRGLGPGKRLRLVLYAHNARGRSEAIAMKIHTLALALVDGKPEKTAAVDVWLLGIIVGISGTFLVIVIITLLARNKRREPLEYEAPLHPVKNTKGGLESNNHSPVQPDDKNPDVVPFGKDFNIGRDIERPPEPPPYGAVLVAPVAASRSTHSLAHQELRTMALHTPVTPASDIQSIVGPLADDRRSLNSGTFRRREIVTTRTPLLANTRESCV